MVTIEPLKIHERCEILNSSSFVSAFPKEIDKKIHENVFSKGETFFKPSNIIRKISEFRKPIWPLFNDEDYFEIQSPSTHLYELLEELKKKGPKKKRLIINDFNILTIGQAPKWFDSRFKSALYKFLEIVQKESSQNIWKFPIHTQNGTIHIELMELLNKFLYSETVQPVLFKSVKLKKRFLHTVIKVFLLRPVVHAMEIALLSKRNGRYLIEILNYLEKKKKELHIQIREESIDLAIFFKVSPNNQYPQCLLDQANHLLNMEDYLLSDTFLDQKSIHGLDGKVYSFSVFPNFKMTYQSLRKCLNDFVEPFLKLYSFHLPIALPYICREYLKARNPRKWKHVEKDFENFNRDLLFQCLKNIVEAK